MCGRFALTIKDVEELIAALEADDWEGNSQYSPDFNIAPSKNVPIARHNNGRKMEMARWGIPKNVYFSSTSSKNHSHSDKSSQTLVNIRSETLLERHTFDPLLATGRCVVPASGYYEWLKADGASIPYYIYPEQNNLWFFAGLYWPVAGEMDFAVVTREPLKPLAFIHNRMPVILSKNQAATWLEDDFSHKKPKHDLFNSETANPQFHSVSKKVNSVAYNGSDCLEKHEYYQQPSLF